MDEQHVDQEKGVQQCATAFQVEQDDVPLTLSDLSRKVYRGRGVILKGSLIALGMATAVGFILPTRYTSTTSFIPPGFSSNNNLASIVSGQLSALGASDLVNGTKNVGDLYAGILKSRSVASEIIKQCDLMSVYRVKKESQAEKTLSSNTSIAVDPKSSIVTVSVTDKSPVRAHDIASAYMEMLYRVDARLALTQSSQRRLFFGDQLAKEKDELEDAEVELKKTEEQSGLIAPSGQTETEIRTIAETQAQIALREVQLAALRDSATEQNPDVIRLHSEIDDLQGQLSRLQRGGGNASSAAIPTSKVPELQLEYVRKEREVKYHEALFDMLSRQYEAARLDEARDSPLLQVLDPASYPDSKSSPKRFLISLSGFLLGLLGSCVWVVTREQLYPLVAATAPPDQS